jgi:hypothetical protein
MESDEPEKEGILDKLPYLLRKQTLKDEMPEFHEEREVFRRAASAAAGDTMRFDRMLAIVVECAEGRKVLNTAIDLARQNGSELVVMFYTEIIPEMKERVVASGIRYKFISKPTSATGDIMFIIKKEHVDLVIIPNKFSDKLSGMSQVTKQVVAEATESSVLVIR